jgi:homoserine trans-succinylase
VLGERFDGRIITGAPVVVIPLMKWSSAGTRQHLEWSRKNVWSNLNI